MTMLSMLLFLLVKHFIGDFILQREYQYKNKGKYAHPGGILHAAIHGIGTFFVLKIFVSVDTAAIYAFIDFVIHYHIDWIKSQMTRILKVKMNSNLFWFFIGLDQLAHHVTYIFIVYSINF